MENTTVSREVIYSLVNNGDLNLSATELAFVNATTAEHPECSSIYLEKSLIHNTRTDIAYAVANEHGLDWFEYDNSATSIKTPLPSCFISFDPTVVLARFNKNQQLKQFFEQHTDLKNLSFLLYRLQQCCRQLPIEHFGYMCPRTPTTLRICTSAMSIEQALRQHSPLTELVKLQPLLTKIASLFNVKLSLNVGASHGNQLGIECHPTANSRAAWQSFFDCLVESGLAAATITNSAQNHFDQKLVLSGKQMNKVSTLTLAHVKLSFAGQTLKDIKTYLKAGQMPFF